MLFDSHIHTTYSADSEMTRESACKKARELGYGLVVTDHMDLMFENERFTFDVGRYFDDYGRYRDDSFLIGIELGMQEKCANESKAVCEQGAFDYVLGSQHIVDETDIYLREFYDGRTKQEAYNLYFSAMLACLKKYDFIDALGHIDYICRYAAYREKDIVYAEHQEQIDAILEFLIGHGIVMEINSRRLSDRQAVKFLTPIYSRYRALGGLYVTIGSDAHVESAIGCNFQQSLELAQFCDLRPVYFKQRKIEWMK